MKSTLYSYVVARTLPSSDNRREHSEQTQNGVEVEATSPDVDARSLPKNGCVSRRASYPNDHRKIVQGTVISKHLNFDTRLLTVGGYS